MTNPPLKAFERSLSDFEKSFVDYPAEKQLLDDCRSGKDAVIYEQRPKLPTKQNTVRASFLRFLALGGDERALIHEKGVQLSGAWIEGKLDFEGATLPNSLRLTYCHLTTTNLRDSVVHGCLLFQVCHVEGLEADRMVCSGTVFLSHVISTSEVSFAGAQIGGDLVCDGGKFDGKEGNALICDRAKIKGCVFLRNEFSSTGTVSLANAQVGGSLECTKGMFDGKGGNSLSFGNTVIKGDVYLNGEFTATGEVAMIGAQIGGDLVCENGQFVVKDGNALSCDGAVIKGCVVLKNGFTATGTVRLQGAKIGGDLECSDSTLDDMNGYALLAENMTVAGMFFFLNLSVKGVVSLVSAKVGSLEDDLKSWPEGKLDLDGFVYDRLSGIAPKDAKTRLKWLDKQSASHAGLIRDGKDFKPQPWKQLQKVLYDMGHFKEVRLVAIAFEDRRHLANLIGQAPENWNKARARIYRKISRCFHCLYGVLLSYGHYSPSRLIVEMLIVWLLCGAFYWYAALYGDNGNGVFAPSNPLVFQNPEYAACVPASPAANLEGYKLGCGLPSVQGAGNWYLCRKLPEEYTGFSPFAYSLDLILPLVDLQQEHDWAPRIPTPKNTWTDELLTWDFPKHCTRFLMWFEILFGWVSSLLLVAVVSGLTKRREE
ncbi:MAG: hypothetical protein Q8L15_12290 [Methylobacter sp.]|nr:hypothetical protein [Methylobacter sp.]